MHSSKLTKSKILLTGGAGFIGNYVVADLLKRGVSRSHIIIPRSKKFDLRNRDICQHLTRGVDVVIHLAANAGGIGKNRSFPGTLFYDNAIMGMELMHAACLNKVKKFVTIGTVCEYPKLTPVPFREEYLWYGYPEETNAPYGLAKKMLLVQAQAYRQQFGLNSIHILLVNSYGPGDNFDPENSHVIPALINKIYDAKINKKKSITVWGTGDVSREFLYVEDSARAIVLATEHYNKSSPINVGGSNEIKVKELVLLIARIMNYSGTIIWDTTKPNGQPRRKLDVQKAKQELSFEAKIDFEEGLKKTINWYIQQLAQNK